MKGMLVAVVLGAVLCAPPAAASNQESGEKNDPEITATGSGQIETDPDKARVGISIRSFGETVDEAAELCISSYRCLLDTLEASGISSERVITKFLEAYPEYDRKKRDKIIGYMIGHQMFIDTKDTNEILEIAGYVLCSEKASVNITWLLSSRGDSVRSMAMAEATLNARAEAEEMASSAGGRLGELIELTNDFPENPRFPNDGITEALALKGGIIHRSSIKPQKIKVKVSVLGRWKLIDQFKN